MEYRTGQLTELKHNTLYPVDKGSIVLLDAGFNLIWKEPKSAFPFQHAEELCKTPWFVSLQQGLENGENPAQINLIDENQGYWIACLKQNQESYLLELVKAKNETTPASDKGDALQNQELFKSIAEPILVYHKSEKKLVYANKAYQKLTGLDLAENPNSSLFEGLGFSGSESPENAELFLNEHSSFQFQSTFQQRDGRKVPIHVSYFDFTQDETALRLFVFSSQTKDENQLLDMLEKISIGILYHNPDGIITAVNSAAAKMLGRTKSELIGCSYACPDWTILNPDLTPITLEDHPFIKAKTSGSPVYSQLIGLSLKQNDTKLWLEVSVVPEYQEGEKTPFRFATSFYNVSEQVRAQKNLQHQNISHKLLTRNAQTFINLPLEEVDCQIQQTMKELGENFETDRFYIFEYNFEAQTCTNTYEWCAEGISPEIQNLQDFPVDHIPDWVNAHKTGKIMEVQDVLALEEKHPMRQILEPQGIQSMITVPLMNQGVCIGFIGLDAVKKKHVFTEIEKDMLLVFAEMLVNIHNRINQINYLKEKETLFKRITENSSDMILIADSEFKPIYVSPSVIRVFDESPESFIAKKDPERYTTDTYDKLLSIRFEMSQAIQKEGSVVGKTWNLEGEAYKGNGDLFWFSTNFQPNLDENGKIIGWIGVTRDITTKKTYDLEFKRNQERLEKMVENQTIYVMRTDMQGRHTYWNKKFEEDCGFLFEGREHKPGDAELTVMEYERPKMRKAVYACIAEPGKVIQVELDKPKKDGSIRTTLWEFVCLTNDDGVPSEMQCMGLDITDRKRTEKLIQKSEEKYRSLVESTDSIVVLYDPEGIILFCNTIAAQNFGKTPDEIIGRSTSELVSPEEFKDIINNITWVIQNNAGKVFEPSLLINGKTLWLRTSIQPVRDEQGNVYAVLMNSTNITDQKQARLKLEESEQRFKSLFFGSPDAHLIMIDGRYSDCNEAACKLLGYSYEEIVGKTPTDISPEFQKNGVLSKELVIRNLEIAKQKSKLSFDWLHEKSDGTTIECEVTLTSINQKDGNITFVSWQEITEVKAIQNALKKSEERFSQVVSQSKTVVWEVNNEGLYTYVSQLAAEVYGYTPEELVGKMYFYDLHPEEIREAYKQEAEELFKQEQPISEYENPIVKKSGELIWVSTNGIPFYNEVGKIMGFRGSDIDITEKKQALEELNKFRMISDEANYGTAITLMDGTITYINRTFAEMHGYSTDELLGKNLTVFHNESQLPRVFFLLEEMKQKGGFAAEEVDHVTRDGNVFPTLMSGKLIMKENKPLYFAATAIDISALKQTEQELRKREDELNYAQEIAEMGSWEYNFTSQQTILSNAYYKLIERKREEHPPSFENYLSIIHPDDRYMIDETLEKINRFQQEETIQIRLLMPDGRIKWVRNSIVPIFKNKLLVGLKGVNINITQQKQQEEQIKQQNQQLSAIIDALPDPVFISDEQGNFIDYVRSSSVSSTRDYSGHVNTNISNWLSPEYSKKVVEKIKEALSNQIITTIEYPAFDIDQSHKVFESRIVPLEQNRVLRMVRDITERKLQEEEIRKLTKAIEQSPVAIIITNLETEILYASPGTLKITGYKPEELIGKKTRIFKSGKTGKEAYKQLWETLNKGETWEFEWINRRKNGTEYWESTSISPLANENGEITGYMSIKQDVSERKRAEEEIRLLNSGLESKIEERTQELQLKTRELETFFNVALDLLCIADINGHFIKVNKAWGTILGYPVEELEGQSFMNFVHPEDIPATYQALENLENQNLVRSFTNRYRTADGTYRFIEWHSVPVGVLIYSAARDITDRILQENALKQAREAAELANKAKSDFLSRMSHELRTPMNSILGFAQLLEMGELNQQAQKSVNHILKSGKHLLNLINEVLDISRIEAGRISISIEPVSIQSVFDEVSDLLKPTAAKNQISLYIPKLENDWMIDADKQRIKQILINLIGNAIKYNKPGGWVNISTKPVDIQGFNWMRIEVSDNGQGIAQEDLERIFQPFERVGDESVNTEGTGLGLAVVKQLTDLMGGIYGVKSQPGEGSTFWVKFRTSKVQQKNLIAESILKDEEQKLKKNLGKILYIEDNQSNVELLENVLSLRFPGIQLVSHPFGKDTLKLALEHKPDLIFLDLNLPDGHGSTFLAELLKNDETRSIPVYVVSADAMPETISGLMKIGAKGYITKPIDISVLLNLINEHLA
ncbi:MAG: PAS domain S-box protein [Bacteroidetes bacterium]|nr:PAS domain S-box protein [Bacteroidota bacterium]